MELSPSWEAANCAATQELSSILWNPKVNNRVRKNPPLVLILSHINPIHIIPSYLSKIILCTKSHIHFLSLTSLIQGIRPGPRLLENFRNKLIFYGEELLAPRPTPMLEDHPLSAARDCLLYIRSYSPYPEGVSSIHNLRTRHAVVTRDPPNMELYMHCHAYMRVICLSHLTLLDFIILIKFWE
jgi:hypothetical protein